MNKPDWKDAPEWANWLAQDGVGYWYWYEQEPVTVDNQLWISPSGWVYFVSEGEPNRKWYETLEQRPASIRNMKSFDATAELNPNLIAAAPDLLEALKVIVENGGIGPESMFHDARAAIAKAEGGEV